MSGTPLIFLDCEATGLCPDIHTPWEIAWRTAIHDPTNKVLAMLSGFKAYVKLSPRQFRLANDTALSIGRFEERYGTDGPMLDTADIISVLRKDAYDIAFEAEVSAPPHLVGAVPSFDHNMLCVNWLGWPDFGEGLWHYHTVDIEVLAAGKLGIAPPYSSSDLTSALGVTVDEATKHTAMGDVDWAVKMYAAVYDLEVIW